jgi:hypothetical protein
VGRYQRWRSRQTTTISSSRASWWLQAGLLLNPPSSTSDSGPPQVLLSSSRRVLPSRLRVPSSLSGRREGDEDGGGAQVEPFVLIGFGPRAGPDRYTGHRGSADLVSFPARFTGSVTR